MKRIVDFFSSRSKKNKRSKNARRRLVMEQLDRRVVLANDFAAIAGVVFEDVNGDNVYQTTDTEIQGVVVRLTRVADNAITDSPATGLDGAYRFDGLIAGDYTIQQFTIPAPSPPNAANLVPIGAAQAITITAEQADTEQRPVGVGPQQVIDAFTEDTGVGSGVTLSADTIANPPGNPNSRSDSVGAIGDTRDMTLTVTSTPSTGTSFALASNTAGNGLLEFNPAAGVRADFVLAWDGDNDPATFDNVIGLNGQDLTAGGTATHLQLRMGGDRTDATDTVTIEIFSDGGTRSSVLTQQLPDSNAGDFEILVALASLPATTGGGADLTAVDAIRVTVSTNSGAIDGSLAIVRTIGSFVQTANIQNQTLNPQIVVEKSTNGIDADTGTGPLIAVGGTATFTYTVTNPGNVEIATVVVTDDNGTAGNTADDFTAVFATGDTDGDGRLDPGETWNYTAVADARTVTAGQYTNISTVTGNPVDGTGTDIAGLADVTDTDPSNHFGVNAQIVIEKATNGQDADTGTGPLIAVGGTATFTYTVTNPGNVEIATVVVTDDNGTAGNTADDFTAVFATGDTDGDGRLDPGETWNYTAVADARTVTAGQYTNISTVTGNPVDGTGTAIAGLADVTDTDPSNHFGVNAQIVIEKATNGQDADTGTGPLIAVGGTATFTYTVTNPGNVEIATVVVTDDNGTAGNTADDFTAVFATGDTDGDGRLDPGETWNYTAVANARTVTAGQYTNISTVTGNPVDGTGTDIAGLADVTDTDPSNHFGVDAQIVIEKATNGQDADTGTGPLIAVGGTATFTYTVTNPGNVEIATVVVTDDNGTAGNTADDFTAVFATGDTDGDGRLDPGETWNYTAVANARTVTAGQYTNISTVTGNPVDGTGTDIAGLADVTDTDPSNHFGVDAQIVIEKATNGQDADTGTGPLIAVGGTATFTYTVTNPGNVEIATVVVTDDNGTAGNTADDFTAVFATGDTDGDGRLDPGETWNYTAVADARTVTAGQYTNISTVTGNPVDGTGTDIAGLADVTDTDPSNHFGFTPAINIEKATNGVDSDTGPGADLLVGALATFTYSVTNTGDIALTNVVVTDDNGTPGVTNDDLTPTFTGGDTNGDNALDLTETWVYTASRTVTAGLHTNISTAEGQDPSGATVNDTDPSNHTGILFSKRRFLASFVQP